MYLARESQVGRGGQQPFPIVIVTNTLICSRRSLVARTTALTPEMPLAWRSSRHRRPEHTQRGMVRSNPPQQLHVHFVREKRGEWRERPAMPTAFGLRVYRKFTRYCATARSGVHLPWKGRRRL